MIAAAELKVRVAIEGIPQSNAKIAAFEGNLKRVSGYDATATLQANVEGRGFQEFDAQIDRARIKTARPISQKVKADVDQRSFAATLAEVAALKSKIDSASGGGLGSHLLGIATPFGKLPSLIALASPEVLALAGAAGALAGSLSEAALGAGALAVGGGGMATVGIAGIVSVAAPAVSSLKELTKAQDAYIQSVETYGVQSSEAESAGRKLIAAEKGAGKEAVAVVRGLDQVKERWADLTKPGREAFLGALGDGLDHLEAKLPLLSKSANRSTKSMRHDFDLFLNEVTGKGSGLDHFIGDMTDLFVHEGPMISHILADWAKVFEHLAEAAGPSLEEVTKDFSDFSDNVLRSSENAPKLRREVGDLVGQTMSWVHLLTQAGDLVITLFGAGAGEGQSLVEDTTGKLEDWRRALEADPSGMEDFFEHSVDVTKELGDIIGMIAEQWFVVAQAMEPVDHAVHGIAVALNSIKIGNVSGLTILLGAITTLSIGKKVLELKSLVGAYAGIQKVLRGEATLMEVLAAREGTTAAAANAEAAANARLAASVEGVSAARSELLIANSSGTVIGTAETVGAGAAAGGTAAAGAAAEGGVAGGILAKAKGVLGKGMTVLGGVAGGYFAAEFGAHVIEGITGADLLENQNLADALTHGFNTDHVLGTEIDALQESRGENFKRSQAEIDHAKHEFRETMQGLSVQAIAGMAAINHELDRGLHFATGAWEKNTPEWRAATVKAMQGAVAEIKQGMDLGVISTKDGKHAINRLLSEIHVIGDDPFAVAKATAETFKEAGSITSGGVTQWLHQLDRMEVGARERTRNTTMGILHAWAQGHPKIEAQVDGLTENLIGKFGATNKQLREGVQKGATGPIARAFHQMAGGSSEALDNLGINVNRMLKALGTKDMVQFQALVLTGARGSFPNLGSESGNVKNFHSKPSEFGFGKQTGGVIAGVTEGDSVERMVRPNTFILNREATRGFGFQGGGHVPVILEPGEREFTPEEVNHIGLDTLMFMNSAVPRFAAGGSVEVSGPRALAEMGHAGLGKVVAAANRYLDAHKPKPQPGAGGVNVPAGEGTMTIDGHPVADWIAAILLAARRAGIDFSVSSGYRTDAEQTAIYNSGVRPAAVPKSLGGSGSNHEGIDYPAGAVDISPGAEALDAWLEHSRWANTLIYAGAKDPVHFSHPHGGGYQLGGLVGLQRGGRANLITGPEALNVPTNIAPTPPSKSTKEAEAKTFIDSTSTQENVALRVGKDLLGYGLNYKGAAGVIGNAWRESRWNPASEGTGGGGLWGFTTPPISLADLKAAASTKGVAWDDIDFQTRFMWNSPGNASSLKSALNSQSSAASAAQFFDSEWEHSGIKAMPEREAGAREALRLMTGAGEGVAGGDYTKPSRPPEAKQAKGKYEKYAVHQPKHGPASFVGVTAHYKVATEHLNFGGLPGNLEDCNKELAHRRNQLREYHAALSNAQDPRVRRDLEFNVHALQDRIGKLKRQRVRLVRKREQEKRDRRVKREVKRIEGMADFSAWTEPNTGIFAREEGAFELAEERAGQSVELEPEEPRIPGSATGNETRDVLGAWINNVLAPYVSGTESARYGDVLGVEGSWRNSILGAETYAGEKMADWSGRIDHLHERIGETRDRIQRQRGRVHHLQDRIEEIQGFKNSHPNAWEKYRDEIPDLRQKIGRLRGKIDREQGEIPGFQAIMGALRGDIKKTQTETLPEWEQMLGGVQGLGRTHEAIGSLPGQPSEQFGGNIFSTQMTIHELGLKVPNAIAGLPEAEGPDRTEQLELELQLSKEANQRLAVANVIGPTLAQFEHTYPIEVAPYMGAFAEGGVALVGEKGPELAHFPSGTRVHTASDTQQMLAAAPSLTVRINGHVMQQAGDTRDPVEALLDDRRLDARIEQGVRDTREGLATPGGHSFL